MSVPEQQLPGSPTATTWAVMGEGRAGTGGQGDGLQNFGRLAARLPAAAQGEPGHQNPQAWKGQGCCVGTGGPVRRLRGHSEHGACCLGLDRENTDCLSCTGGTGTQGPEWKAIGPHIGTFSLHSHV